MYTLYFSPGACSAAVRVLLNELGVEYKAVNAWADSTKTTKNPEFLKANPRGAVPTLVDGDQVIREGAAIILYLAEKHKSPLLPTSQPARAKAIEWLCFGNSSLHPAYGRAFWSKKVKVDEAARAQLLEAAQAGIQTMWDDVEKNLANQSYIAGNEVTVGDILLTVIANWSTALPKPLNFGTKTLKLLETISARPSYQKALTDEGVQYKLAA